MANNPKSHVGDLQTDIRQYLHPPYKWRLHPDPVDWMTPRAGITLRTVLLYRSPPGEYAMWFSDIVVAGKVKEWKNEWCDLWWAARRGF